MNIFEKMSTITAALQTVGKNMTVGVGNNKYKAVSERDILDAVKPLEAKHGIYSYPVSREVLESNLLENEKSFTDQKGNTTITKSTTFMTRIKTVYRFVNVENPEEYIETTTFAEGIDTQDKGSGKAMTYADKYALMKGYKISTGDDPDQTESIETHFKKATPSADTTPPVPPTPKKQPTPRDVLIATLKEKGIDANEYATKKGLTKETPPERYEELLKELEEVK